MIRIANAPPLFQPGSLVHHLRYHYRGVVVHGDFICQADEQWYQTNRTQPDKKQPWYHVLVDGSDQTTYAAQDSLQADDSEEPIQHPLIVRFFSGFENARYIRNDQPWPS